jgi:heme/copper-type cytochrome/quinol oxidase subunit 2
MAALLAYTASGWTQMIVALSIFVPVAVALALTIVILRGAKNDPDEQRWRREAEERKRLKQEEADERSE